MSPPNLTERMAYPFSSICLFSLGEASGCGRTYNLQRICLAGRLRVFQGKFGERNETEGTRESFRNFDGDGGSSMKANCQEPLNQGYSKGEYGLGYTWRMRLG